MVLHELSMSAVSLTRNILDLEIKNVYGRERVNKK